MARIDKLMVWHRATAGTALSGVLGVSINAGGSIVPAGSATIDGVVCVQGTIAAGKPVSIIKRGEIVEFGGANGTVYYAAQTTGAITSGSVAGSSAVGKTLEGDRLVVTL